MCVKIRKTKVRLFFVNCLLRKNIFRIFFTEHFKQSVLEITGIRQYLMNPIDFKMNFGSAKTQGKTKGVQVGYNWITKAGDLNV